MSFQPTGKTLKNCVCEIHAPHEQQFLTDLALDCWQRMYDRRPYNTLSIHGKLFEKHFHRPMNNDDFHILFNFVTKRHQIKHLELLYQDIPEIVSEQIIELAKRLSVLCLCHVQLSADALECLSEIASECASLKVLRLNGNHFDVEHADHLRTFLMAAPSLQYLDIGYCDLNHQTLAIISDGIHQCKSLRVLDMSRIVQYNQCITFDSSKIASIIAILILQTELVELHCRHCGIEHNDIVPIAEYLENPLIHLTYLDLAANNIGPIYTESIFKAVANSKTLLGLDISHNNIGETGAKSIGKYLQKTRLRYLDVSHNNITANGMKFIINNIIKEYPLRIFNLWGNQYDSEFADKLRLLIDAKILLTDAIDANVSYDTVRKCHYVVMQINEKAMYSHRYHRVAPLIRNYDILPKFTWDSGADDESALDDNLLLDALYLDPLCNKDCDKSFDI